MRLASREAESELTGIFRTDLCVLRWTKNSFLGTIFLSPCQSSSSSSSHFRPSLLLHSRTEAPIYSCQARFVVQSSIYEKHKPLTQSRITEEKKKSRVINLAPSPHTASQGPILLARIPSSLIPVLDVWMRLNTNVMASTSNQGVELVDDDIMMEVETSDELDIIIDESDYTSRSDIMIESPKVEFAREVGPSEPYIGLEFNSSEEGREYYAAYGRRNGFTVRVNRKRKSRVDRAVIGFDYVCSKEGFRPKKCLGEDKTIQLSKQSRVGCKAFLVIAYRREIEKWVVTNFFKEHNHELLGPSNVLVRRSLDDASNEDAKDKRIRELTAELDSERQRFQRKCSVYEERCASYKLNLSKILKDIELHSEHLTRRVEEVIRRIEEIEDDEEAELHYEHLTNRVQGVVQPIQAELRYEHLTNRVEGAELHYERLTNRVEGVVQPIQAELHYEHLRNRVEEVAQPIQEIKDDEHIELHSEHLTKRVEGVVQTIKEIEDDEEEDELHSEHLTKRIEGIVQTIKEIEYDDEYLMGIELSDLGSLDC